MSRPTDEEMASDRDSDRTWSLERIARAAERIAAALEKMACMDPPAEDEENDK